MLQTREIGPFSGHVGAQRDTEDGRDEAERRNEELLRGKRDDLRDRDAGDDRAPLET
ncbi:MAG TPA: hypothetical protein VEU77_06735 [Candidatus Acidoferrales bacterium]|nr:hypothetical protein [Candidatus Acidoferrales bacterium]